MLGFRMTTLFKPLFTKLLHQITVLGAWWLLFALLSSTTLAATALKPYISFTSQAMLFVLVVAIAAYQLDRVQSIVGAVASVLLLNFFFVPPTWTFHVEQSEHLIALGTMLVVALVINQLTTRLKQETALAHLNEQRARQLQELAIRLASTDTTAAIRALGQAAFERAFHGRSCLVLADEGTRLDTRRDLSTQQIDGLRCCMKEMQLLGAGSLRWGDLEDWYVPLGRAGQNRGAVLIQKVAAKDEDGREHAKALCSLLTQAFERLQLNLNWQSAQNEAQKQQLQSTFLSAISHDLRTPLAVMVGAASALQSQRDKLAPDQQDRLLNNIIAEANYLTNVTENTLQLVRLTHAENSLRRDWESIEEIVGAVLARIKQANTESRIQASLAQDLPLLRLDPILIAQLLSNLIDNALKYSDGMVELEVRVLHKMPLALLQVEVKDRGPGIPEAEHDSIFVAYSRLAQHDQSNQRSAGLGLAVCHAIAKAHGGDLVVHNRAQGGSCFLLTLPIPNAPAFAAEISAASELSEQAATIP
jgi:two-component system sensor histidine kinase KdpD